ncbi:MAG: hypothetical protein V4492_08105 [Chlamydiota bacterium]
MAPAFSQINFLHREPSPGNENSNQEMRTSSRSDRQQSADAHRRRDEHHPSRLELGGDYTRLWLKPHGSQQLQGNLYGAQGIYEYRPMDSIYSGTKLSWKEGKADGHGHRRSLFYVDAQERLGYTAATETGSWMVSFFTGLGYRHVQQKAHPRAEGIRTFRYNELYVPVGLASDWEWSRWFSFGLNLTWMPQVYSTVVAGPLKRARWKLPDTLANYSIEMPLDFTLSKSGHFHLIIKPFWEHWQDGRTTARDEAGNSMKIPGNTYNYVGCDLNLGFCF